MGGGWAVAGDVKPQEPDLSLPPGVGGCCPLPSSNTPQRLLGAERGVKAQPSLRGGKRSPEMANGISTEQDLAEDWRQRA
jgi:hypothetical protein